MIQSKSDSSLGKVFNAKLATYLLFMKTGDGCT